MIITNMKHTMTLQPSTGWVRKYQKEPGNQEYAVRACLQKVRSLKKDSLILVKGNSYMRTVFHIVDIKESIGKYVPGQWPCKVLVIKFTGEIFQADASDF